MTTKHIGQILEEMGVTDRGIHGYEHAPARHGPPQEMIKETAETDMRRLAINMPNDTPQPRRGHLRLVYSDGQHIGRRSD